MASFLKGEPSSEIDRGGGGGSGGGGGGGGGGEIQDHSVSRLNSTFRLSVFGVLVSLQFCRFTSISRVELNSRRETHTRDLLFSLDFTAYSCHVLLCNVLCPLT